MRFKLPAIWSKAVPPRAEKYAVSRRVERAVAQLVAELNESLVSILHYPHPCTTGGIVIVLRDDVESLLDLVATSYALTPRSILLHCLRRAELSELSLPLITWLDVVNVHLQMPFWLKFRGVVLYGQNILSEIQLPAEPGALLGVHLDVCAHSIRNHVILAFLTRRDYLGLIKKLDWQVRCLMATALLAHDEYHINAETLPERFSELYPDERMEQLWYDLSGLLYATNVIDEDSCRESAFEAVWLFESFLRRLRSYA